MTATPLNWREHMTEEERVLMIHFDQEIKAARKEDAHYTAQRETIRRRVRSRVMSKMRRDRMREAKG